MNKIAGIEKEMVEVASIRYPVPGGVVEVSPHSPVPPNKQKATAAHLIWCAECGEEYKVVTQQPLEGEVVCGGYYPHADPTTEACPKCGEPFNWRAWDDDEFSPNYNTGICKFSVCVDKSLAHELGLNIKKASMPLYYF